MCIRKNDNLALFNFYKKLTMKTLIKFTLLLMIVSNAVLAQTKQLITYYDTKKTKVMERTNVLISNPTVLHGSYKKYGRNTVILEEGNYDNGKQVGIWHYRNESDGFEYKTENYNNQGQLNGEVIERSGKSKAVKHYKNGKPNGSQKAWNEAGILIKDFNFVDGLQDGKQMEYHYATGKLIAEGFYTKGIKSGTWKIYNDDGTFKNELVYDADGNAITTLMEADGTIKGQMKNGYKVGEWKIYYDTEGRVCDREQAERYRIITYDTNATGKYSNKSVGYYMTGEKYWEGEFSELNGNQIKFWDGEETFYYKNGKIKAQGKYERGERTNDWKFYDENGVQIQ